MLQVQLIPAENLRRGLAAVFYGAYIFTFGYLLSRGPDVESRKIYIIMLALVPGGIWCEILRYVYYRGFRALHERCDPEKAARAGAFVRRGDILRQYPLTAPCLEGYALLDLGHAGEVEPLMEQYLRNFSGKRLSVDFPYQYLMFSAYAQTGELEKLEVSWQKLERIFGATERPSASIEGLHQLASGIYMVANQHPGEALEHLKQVDPESLKPRERCRYWFYLAQAYLALEQRELADVCLQKSSQTANGIVLCHS